MTQAAAGRGKATTRPFALPGKCVYPETLEQPENLPAEERYRRLLDEAAKQPKKSQGQAGEDAKDKNHEAPGVESPSEKFNIIRSPS